MDALTEQELQLKVQQRFRSLMVKALLVICLAIMAVAYGVTWACNTITSQDDELAARRAAREQKEDELRKNGETPCTDFANFLYANHPELGMFQRAELVDAARKAGTCK